MTRRPRLVARSLLTSAALAASSIAMVGCSDDEVIGNPKGGWHDAGEWNDAGGNDATTPPTPTVDAGQLDTGTTTNVDACAPLCTDAGEDDAG